MKEAALSPWPIKLRWREKMEFQLWHFSQSSSDSEERGHGGLLLQDQDQMILGHAVLKSQAACPVVRFHPIYCTNCGFIFPSTDLH